MYGEDALTRLSSMSAFEIPRVTPQRAKLWLAENPGYRADVSVFGDRMYDCFSRRTAQTSITCLGRTDLLYSSGQTDNNIYLILSGRVKISTISMAGKECLVGIVAERDLIGETCLLMAQRPETTTAMAPTMIQRIPRHHFLRGLTEEGLFEDYLRYLTARLIERQQLITQLVTANSEKRLAAILLWLAEKLGTRHKDTILIRQRITQTELSEMVGTTRSRIGHFLKKFHAWGMVGPNRDRVLTIHENRLHAYLAGRVGQDWRP